MLVTDLTQISAKLSLTHKTENTMTTTLDFTHPNPHTHFCLSLNGEMLLFLYTAKDH